MSAASVISTIGTWFRVNDALMRREIASRYGDSRLGYVWAIATPAAGMLVFYLFFLVVRTIRPEMPLLMFIATGWATYDYFRTMYAGISGAAEQNKALLMHTLITRLDCMTSRAVLETLTNTVLFMIFVIVSAAIEGWVPPADLGLVIIGFLTAGAFGASLGVFFGAVRTYFPMVTNFVAPVFRVGVLISGVIWTARDLPSWTYDIIKWNPVLHPIEGMREGWFSVYSSPVMDLTYTWTLTAVFLALGLVLERRSRFRIVF